MFLPELEPAAGLGVPAGLWVASVRWGLDGLLVMESYRGDSDVGMGAFTLSHLYFCIFISNFLFTTFFRFFF